MVEPPSGQGRLQSGGCGPDSIARPWLFGLGRLPLPVQVAGEEAGVNACGVATAMLPGKSWAPHLSNGHLVNVGTVLDQLGVFTGSFDLPSVVGWSLVPWRPVLPGCGRPGRVHPRHLRPRPRGRGVGPRESRSAALTNRRTAVPQVRGNRGPSPSLDAIARRRSRGS